MENQIGMKIRELRKYWHMTQGELAHNICSQALISKIEKNKEIHLSAHLLYQLGLRLGVTIDYFFSEDDMYRLNYVNEVCEQITNNIRSKRFKDAFEMVKLEKKNPNFQQTPHLRQFLLWREAICINYLYGDREKALQLLDEALATSEANAKIVSQRELDILISKAIIYSENEEWAKAESLYKNILAKGKRIPLINDESIFINIYYNYSRVTANLKKYELALKLCNQGINLCKKHETFYLLGYLYYQKAEIYRKIQEHPDKVVDCYKKAFIVFKQNGDMMTYEYILEKLNAFREIK